MQSKTLVSVQEFADLCGVSQQQISKRITGNFKTIFPAKKNPYRIDVEKYRWLIKYYEQTNDALQRPENKNFKR